ncbi:hypothetical protein [Anabaena sp. CCY 9910]|uniref:hypothetical protein n=1 Tax=Anabaena sp. CCY 9910 TaxID=3103870 RepID=UPI0039E19BC1
MVVLIGFKAIYINHYGSQCGEPLLRGRSLGSVIGVNAPLKRDKHKWGNGGEKSWLFNG